MTSASSDKTAVLNPWSREVLSLPMELRPLKGVDYRVHMTRREGSIRSHKESIGLCTPLPPRFKTCV